MARTIRGLAAALVASACVVLGQTAAAAAPVSGAGQQSCTMTRTGEYPTASPASLGLDPGKLATALNYASIDGSDTVKVFRYGCLAGHGLRDTLLDRVPTDNYGQTKAILALVTGVVADKGWVDIDKPIGDYLPATLGDQKHRAVTLRELLRESSGVERNHVRGLNLVADQSRARQYFTIPFAHRPGTYFDFNETTPSVVVYVLHQVIEAHEPAVDFQAFTQRELFDRLGIPKSAYFWQRDRAGTTTGYSQLWLRPLEFGRIGQLMASGGTFDGKRIVSERYLHEMLTPAPANCGFGFYIWLNSCRPGQTQAGTDYPEQRHFGGQPWIASAPADMYFTLGLGDSTFVIPSLHMVVTRSGMQELDTLPGALRGSLDDAFPGNPGGPGVHKFFRLLMDAVTDMPASVRTTIQNSGPYDRPPKSGVDLEPFVDPPDAVAGSYLSLGRTAPEGCGPLGCQHAPNNGDERYISQVPRTVFGILGVEKRPDGPPDSAD